MTRTRAALFEDSWSMDPAERDFFRISEPAYLGTAQLVRLAPMHQHRVIAEVVCVLGRAENQPLPERGRC
jgi:hypothetical protein